MHRLKSRDFMATNASTFHFRYFTSAPGRGFGRFFGHNGASSITCLFFIIIKRVFGSRIDFNY